MGPGFGWAFLILSYLKTAAGLADVDSDSSHLPNQQTIVNMPLHVLSFAI